MFVASAAWIDEAIMVESTLCDGVILLGVATDWDREVTMVFGAGGTWFSFIRALTTASLKLYKTTIPQIHLSPNILPGLCHYFSQLL